MYYPCAWEYIVDNVHNVLPELNIVSMEPVCNIVCTVSRKMRNQFIYYNYFVIEIKVSLNASVKGLYLCVCLYLLL